MIALTLEQGKMNDRRHEQVMAEIHERRAEIQDLLALQKEQRVDIMALFQGNKNLREAMEEYFKRRLQLRWARVQRI